MQKNKIASDCNQTTPLLICQQKSSIKWARALLDSTPGHHSDACKQTILRWWAVLPVVGAIWLAAFVMTVIGETTPLIDDPLRGVIAGVLHLPYALILLFLGFGLVERIGFFWQGRAPASPGRMPNEYPTVCVQLPMFNEHSVARRVIEAAASLHWPRERLQIQVLDDSTDPETCELVRSVCAEIQRARGVKCEWVHRSDRTGYKAGALEAGRRVIDAEFIAIFDADFVPQADYLLRVIPHFYDEFGRDIADLALVQAQWGHLNDDESMLTEAQAMWVDDHHTLQQSWRSATLNFVNFTGTGGVWRASAIESVDGWRSASLVEDCELSFRCLFAGWRTKFVKEIVAPAELPQSAAAYRLQQKRWTQGWVQLQRLHLRTLLQRYPATLPRKAYLAYMMCIGWQWPLWMSWMLILPFLIANSLTLGTAETDPALMLYFAPPLLFAIYSAVVTAAETRHTYITSNAHHRIGPVKRFWRIIPYLVLNAGMLPHHFAAFCEGLFGPMHSEFERTPKTASVTHKSTDGTLKHRIQLKRLRQPARPAYIAVEIALFATQLAWIIVFLASGLIIAAIGSTWLAMCIILVRISPFIQRTILNAKEVRYAA